MAVLKTQFTLRLDVGIHAKLAKIAESQSRSITSMIAFLVKQEIDRYEKEHGEIPISDQDLSIR